MDGLRSSGNGGATTTGDRGAPPPEAVEPRNEDPTGVRVRGGIEAGMLLAVEIVFTARLDPGAEP